MARFIKDRTKARGQIPGSLVFIGNQKMEKPIIQFMQYNTELLIEEEVNTIQQASKKIKPDAVNWINIYGLHDLEMIQEIGKTFKLPAMMLEDILNTDQPPKYENGETFDGFILKMMSQEDGSKRVNTEQISIILGSNFLITIQERRGDVFRPVRERIRKNKGRIRKKKNDYLAYALMDTIFDNYTLLTEKIGRQIEELEDRIFVKKDNKILEEIYSFKIELNILRKAVRPVIEIMMLLLKTEDSYFEENNRKYLIDLQDLAKQSTEAIELYNQLVSDQLNIYNTTVGNHMNEVMKTLTIFASVFIPLTFVAGIYGMNFEYIPELSFKYGYALFWAIVLAVAGGLVYFFKRKKWL